MAFWSRQPFSGFMGAKPRIGFQLSAALFGALAPLAETERFRPSAGDLAET